MSVARRRLPSLRKPFSASTLKSSYRQIVSFALLFALFAFSCVMQAQTAGNSQQPTRFIVKLKPSFTHETELQLTGTSQKAAGMHIRAGRSSNARIESFLQRQSAKQLTPLYPQIIQLRKQHGWSDAQVADHIRQRFVTRAHRADNAKAVPEISRTYIVEFGSLTDQEKASALLHLKADPEVEFAEPEHTFTTRQIPNDPFLSTSGTWGQPYQDLWGIYAVNAPAAWDTAQGDGVVVAVIDTGVDYNHPDLADNIWTNPNEIAGNSDDDDGNGFVDDFHGWNFINNSNDPLDDNGHGTHVAGTIAAEGNNGIGVIGVAWHSKIMPLKGFDSNGFGFDFTLAPAITYAANNGADVINASWDSFNSNMQVLGDSQAIEEAIQYASSLGVVFVASAGNSSQDANNFFPANSPEAITVASSDPFGNFSFFSNFGSKIDVTAPGEDILSTQAANTFQGIPVIDGYDRMTGTSMAAAHVSGVVALILSQNPGYSPDTVRTVLRSSATPSFDTRFGAGSLNASAAVALQNVQVAKIAAIIPGATPADPITIQGTAEGPGFASYLLEYGQGAQPFFWTPFFNGFAPVSSGVLGTLDPSNLFASGVYSIRLTVFNTAGIGFANQSQFTINFVQITSPAPTTSPIFVPTFKAGATVPIIGTAGGPGIQTFTIQWSSVSSFNGWQTTGITLMNNGAAPLANATLATWDTSSITQAGFYQIQLSVDNFNFQPVTTEVYLEPDLISAGWPIFVEPGPFSGSGIVPAQNADGTLRMVMESPNDGTIPGVSWVFHADGSFEQTNLNQFGSFHQPAVGNIDGLPGDEAVMPDFNVVRVIHPDTTFDLFSPGPVNVDLTISPLVLADLYNNFQLETVAIGPDLTSNDTAADMFVWLPDGEIAPGFPRQIPAPNNLVTFRNQPRILVGDFNGDGTRQILVQQGLTSNTYTLQLLGTDGTLKTTFNAPVLTGIPFSMAAADLDHNGKLETIVVSNNGPQQTLHVLQPDGTERLGWPVDVTSGQQFDESNIALGDFNRDGHEEIVLAKESAIFLFNSDGTSFSSAWPLLNATYGPAVIGDVDGDGFPEIVTSLNDFNNPQLLAIRKDGTISKSWRLGGANNAIPFIGITPALADFDQNGTTDIAVAYVLSGGTTLPGMVTVLDTHVPYNPANNDWPLIYKDERNSSILVRTATSNLAVTLTAGTNPSVAGDSVTFTATLTPGAGSGSVQFLDGDTPISGSIALNNGTASFTTSALALGTHNITARYTGNNQVAASTSPVLVQTVITKVNADISVRVISATNPVFAATPLTLIANVAPTTATGSIIFFDGASAISGSILLSNGTASFATTLNAGSHSITAQYSGDNNFNSGTSAALAETVLKSNTTTTLTTPDDSVKAGSPATFTATIAPAAATGTVIFFDGTTAISGSVPASHGVAKFTSSTLASGTHSISAQYSGDANFNASTSPVAKVKVK